VLVPFSGDADRVAVLGLLPSSLALRGWIDLAGPALRGFPHARGLVGASAEEVVVVDPATLAVRGRATVAEDVVDAARLPDGRLVTLVRRGRGGTLGGAELGFVPDRCHPVGSAVAVTGYDAVGRVARVVEFASEPPTLSARFDLGSGGLWIPAADGGVLRPDGFLSSVGQDAALTAHGRLVVRRLDAFAWEPGLASPERAAGFVVIDVALSRLEDPVDVPGAVTGFALDGDDLVYTVAGGADPDVLGRPRMRHDLVRVDLPTRALSTSANVPGYVVAASGDLAFTVEESWGDGWEWSADVVAVDLAAAGGAPEVASRLRLPAGAYGFVPAGATLHFTATLWPDLPTPGLPPGEGGGGGGLPPRPQSSGAVDFFADGGFPLPTTRLGVVRLGAALAFGPSLEATTETLSLLLPEDGALLLVRGGLVLERHDVSGPVSIRRWAREIDGHPLSARPDPASAGSYLVALGYAGLTTAP
jgi:hypothetical protein